MIRMTVFCRIPDIGQHGYRMFRSSREAANPISFSKSLYWRSIFITCAIGTTIADICSASLEKRMHLLVRIDFVGDAAQLRARCLSAP